MIIYSMMYLILHADERLVFMVLHFQYHAWECSMHKTGYVMDILLVLGHHQAVQQAYQPYTLLLQELKKNHIQLSACYWLQALSYYLSALRY